ncbi:MAG TPA: TraR/DksA C4-type zinc finger protein [bacterium]|nr:TraR/DksA C4-type zinc finger protein [bacterium]
MTKKESKHSKQKKILLARRQSLLEKLVQNKEAADDMSDLTRGDDLDQAVATRDREMNYMLTNRERMEIKAIEAALDRIENGTYGICEECSEEIEQKRLEVLPFARYCRDCQTEIENRSGRKENPAEMKKWRY